METTRAKDVRKAIHLAFSTWSRLPLPAADWTVGSKAALAAFPLVGIPLALLMVGYARLADVLGLGRFLFAAFAVAVPVVYTGGIHLDGFLDVADAVSSRAAREKKLAILKDPHVGAFALIWLAVWALTSLGLWTELNGMKAALALAPTYVQSRLLTVLIARTLPNARGDGMCHDLNRSSEQIPWFHLGAAAALFIVQTVFFPAAGLITLALFAAAFVVYRGRMNYHFGGLTGDTLGCFVVLLEWLALLAVLIGQTF